MRRRRRAPRGESIFELLSDISLSALGLFLIVFVIYAVLFDSSGASPQENERLRSRNEELDRENERLADENTSLEEQLADAGDRAEAAEQELLQIEERTELTGYYSGDIESKLYARANGCTGAFTTVYGEQNLLYIGTTNTIVYSTVYPGHGELTYRFQGELTGNVFESDDTQYSRTQALEACGNPTQNRIRVEFYDDNAKVYFLDGTIESESKPEILRRVT
ncbi:hypothetical protein KR51_00008950 [Rubidibacter lacunae KORDI 51-2]|uniref:Uncharacterized protein n=1 Tax=Rubidibacter lacunae KORDI 51-2 TaxID=582515 RepID=U5DP35_9CHRO|nr:hypothetical protein [Rubidibacter lacunae]ERN42374.1 hypothetical protein KR51_00008950 [Rubidibacter lacunae KORDI 51-2]